jgi:transcriptional regulator with XRE-family HTH domain
MANTTNSRLNDVIGRYLKEARTNANVTQGQMAISLGMSKNHISALERGKCKVSVDVLMGYCKRLKTTPDVILHYK